jgi:hypothetical protein
MPYRGNLARKIGKYRWYTAAACLRACLTLSNSRGGRIMNTPARFSSSASFSAIRRKYRSAFLRLSTDVNASTWMRHSTNSADAGGRSVDGISSGTGLTVHGTNGGFSALKCECAINVGCDKVNAQRQVVAPRKFHPSLSCFGS